LEGSTTYCRIVSAGALFFYLPNNYLYKAEAYSMTVLKTQLRTEALIQRRALSPDQRNRFSLEIEHRLFEYLKESITKEHHLLAYRALPEEVDTTALFETPPCHIYAPRMHGSKDMHWLRVNEKTNWISGSFGILEPESGPDWNHESGSAILLCPLVGFDRKGNRLGMGKGCFDRWLERYQSRINSIIGLAFSCQELPAIPVESHDIPLQTIITEKEVISCPTT
jgi:5-formyltetrahydrofolate cyclo-ligase